MEEIELGNLTESGRVIIIFGTNTRYGTATVRDKTTATTPKKPEPLVGVNSNVAPKGFFDVPVFTGDERIIVFKRCYTKDLMGSSGVLTAMLREPWLPDGLSRIFRIVCVRPFGLLDYGFATLRCKI